MYSFGSVSVARWTAGMMDSWHDGQLAHNGTYSSLLDVSRTIRTTQTPLFEGFGLRITYTHERTFKQVLSL